MYYVAYHAFWAALIAVPLVDNLGLAWLLVEATTGASALLVAYSGTRGALEAGWKYLVLTTFGLAVAMLGIIVLYVAIAPGDGTLATLDWQSIARAAPGLHGGPAVVAFVLIVAGLATKVGWAPVHNWLPDAHSEAPPPVSALLSAALLPTVVLVTWRVVVALGPALTAGTASALVLAFGLVSLAVAVPFLWRSMAWKRLLAYSSLEHMGVLAIGIGFATPLATAGVVVHVAGHALAKSLGFYAAGPLLRHAPRAHERAVRGLAFANPPTASAVGVSLGALAAMPPSPLFVSELLILLGGITAGEIAVTVVAALLLALGFLGLAHALVDALVGEPRVKRWRSVRSGRRLRRLTVVCGTLMLALTVVACLLPGSSMVEPSDGRDRDDPRARDRARRRRAAGAPRSAPRSSAAPSSTACTRRTPSDEPAVRLALRQGAARRLLTARATDAQLDTIVDLLPAAEWDEREAHDLHGVHFDGHEPLRAARRAPGGP